MPSVFALVLVALLIKATAPTPVCPEGEYSHGHSCLPCIICYEGVTVLSPCGPRRNTVCDEHNTCTNDDFIFFIGQCREVQWHDCFDPALNSLGRGQNCKKLNGSCSCGKDSHIGKSYTVGCFCTTGTPTASHGIETEDIPQSKAPTYQTVPVTEVATGGDYVQLDWRPLHAGIIVGLGIVVVVLLGASAVLWQRSRKYGRQVRLQNGNGACRPTGSGHGRNSRGQCSRDVQIQQRRQSSQHELREIDSDSRAHKQTERPQDEVGPLLQDSETSNNPGQSPVSGQGTIQVDRMISASTEDNTKVQDSSKFLHANVVFSNYAVKVHLIGLLGHYSQLMSSFTWMDVAGELGFSAEQIRTLQGNAVALQKLPAELMIDQWITTEGATLNVLVKAIGRVGRHDIVESIRSVCCQQGITVDNLIEETVV